MSGKKSKKKNPRPTQPLVRLSQCMIVKNEEKNIEKALSWAKDIAFEQIVVDTGSTDRTVEIAEKLGAKVCHFVWIDDFSAAKNFAIEQAKGNWIAFLDADEYFTPEDAKKLMILLKQIQSNPEHRRKYLAIACPWVQLDDNLKPFAVHEQNRVFQNHPSVRYNGKIHEGLTITTDVPFAPEISIMHTGYNKEAYRDTGKANRNIEMLRKEMEIAPDNPNLMVYLADSLRIEPRTKEKDEEAEALYRKALDNRDKAHPQLVKNAYYDLIAEFLKNPEKLDDVEKYASMAYKDFPEDIDFTFYYGTMLSRLGRSREAFDVLMECERLLINTDTMPVSLVVLPNPLKLFYEIALAAQAIGDIENTIKYVTLTLKEEKFQADVLPQYMNILKNNGVSEDDIISLLGKLYNYNNLKDKLFLMRCAKISFNIGLYERVRAMLSDDEREWIDKNSK